MPVAVGGAPGTSGFALGWECRPIFRGTAVPYGAPFQKISRTVRSNGSKTHSTLRPARTGSVS